jgi:hypothetical protein
VTALLRWLLGRRYRAFDEAALLLECAYRVQRDDHRLAYQLRHRAWTLMADSVRVRHGLPPLLGRGR